MRTRRRGPRPAALGLSLLIALLSTEGGTGLDARSVAVPVPEA